MRPLSQRWLEQQRLCPTQRSTPPLPSPQPLLATPPGPIQTLAITLSLPEWEVLL